MVASRKAQPVDAEIDLKDPGLFASGAFPAVLARLRAEEPIYWNPEADSTGFWAVTRYDDAVMVVQDPETFSADVKNGGMRIFNKPDVTSDPKPHMLAMDPPIHTQMRKAVQAAFTPAAVAASEGRIRARMTRLVDAIAPTGRAEFVTAVAAPLTLGLLADLLGVPETDGPQLFNWSNAFIGDDDPDYQASLEVRLKALDDVDAYAGRLLEDRQKVPGKDFVSLLAAAKLDGKPLDFGTYTENFGAFLIAGNETTRHTLSTGMVALALFPEERAKLIAEPSLMPSAVKEITRWATPLMHVRRTAMRDTEISGRKIRKGDKVVVWYYSANRDEAKWADPGRFDVARFADRSATAHIAFGSGPHFCLGWRFAELQISVALEELLARIPDFRLADDVRLLRSNFIGGVKQVNITFTPEAGKAS
jgi:linalool 8-monooxygenase